MSVTATTEIYPASLCQRQPYWLETDDGQCVPLILSEPSSNVVVFKLDTKLKAKGHALKMELKPPTPIAFSARRSLDTEQSILPYSPQETLTPALMAPIHDHTSSGTPRRQPFVPNLDAIMRNSYPDNPSAFPRSPTDSDRKEYCSYWIRHGECDYMQQGCRYKHEMPDLMTLRSIGFRNVPEWHKEKMRMRNMRRPALPHLQSILNKINDDSDSVSGGDEPAATRIAEDVPSCPVPSTIDLLSFDSDSDSDSESTTPSSSPKVPENTPETSSYALPSPPTPNRQGRFIPAGESLPRMSTTPLQPSPPSPSIYKTQAPKSPLEKTLYMPPQRQAPIYKQYFQEIKAAKSQELLLEGKKEKENAVKISPADAAKDAQIAELQAKLAALAAVAREVPKLRTAFLPALASSTVTKVKTPPAPTSSPNQAPSPIKAIGLMASKYADRHFQSQLPSQPQIQAQSQLQSQPQSQSQTQTQAQPPPQIKAQAEKKVSRRSRSRVRDVQRKSTEGGGPGCGSSEKRSRRLPAVRTRKVVLTKAVGGEGKEGSVGVGVGGRTK